MKRFIILFVSSLLLIFLMMYFRYDADYKLRYLVDVMWLIGVIYFAFGIFGLSNVRRLFRSIGFSFQRFMSKDLTHASYYDYYMQKEKQDTVTGVPALLVGLIHIIISLVISYRYFV